MTSAFGSIKFGFADAQTEGLEAPELLLDGFLDDGDLTHQALRGYPFLFLGYKGSGKTAIVERARLLASHDASLFATSVTLDQFSYADFCALAGDSGGVESRYPAAWAWSLLVQLVQSFDRDAGASVPDSYTRAMAGLRELGLLPAPPLHQLVRQSSQSGFRAGIPRFLEGVGERVSAGEDMQLAQMADTLRRAVMTVHSESRHVVFVDGLDESLSTSRRQFEAIATLIVEVSRLNSAFRASDVPAKFVVLCRTDIFDRLPGANKNKIRQDGSLELDWYDDPRGPAGTRLHRLIDLRARVSLGRAVEVFEEFLPPQTDGRPTLRYLFDHTRHTPRDTLQLMRSIQEFGDGSQRLTEAQVRSGLHRYSTGYFLPELRDELHGYASPDEIEHVLALFSTLRRDRFTLDELTARMQELDFAPIDLADIVRTLFECGGLGMVEERPGGRSHYTFKFRNRTAVPILSRTWVIHLGALKALNIDRRR